jgi:hypothetical protein
MFKRLLAALLGVAFATAPLVALATDRTVWYGQQTITSSGLNQQARNERLAFGTWLMAELNLTGGVGTGTYWNINATPGTGLYVTMAPGMSSTNGWLAQVQQNDTQLPTTCPNPTLVTSCPKLAADPTLIAVLALLNTTTAPLGPLTAPGTAGQSVYWLIESQVQPPTDQSTTASPFMINVGGATAIYQPQNFSVNIDRTDPIGWQTKEGAPGTSPTQPTTDSGYQAVAYVLIPYGTTQITTGMITAAQAFSGFAQGSAVTSVGGANNINVSVSSGAVTISDSNSPTWTGTATGAQLNSAGPILAGSTTAFIPSSPHVSASTSTTSGGLDLGGSAAHCKLDYGETTASALTLNCPTTVVGSLTAPSLQGTSSNVTGGWLNNGTLGAASSAILRFGNATSGSSYTSIGAPNSGSCSGIQNSIFSVGNTGAGEICGDGSGNFGVVGSLHGATVAVDGASTPGSGFACGNSSTACNFSSSAGTSPATAFAFNNPTCSGSNLDILQLDAASTLKGYIGCDGSYTANVSGGNTVTLGGSNALAATSGQIYTNNGPVLAGYGGFLPNSLIVGDYYSASGTTSGGIWFGLQFPTGHICGISWAYPTLTEGCAVLGTQQIQADATAGVSPPTVSGGDLSADETASAGKLVLGGSSSSASIDYGVTTPSVLTSSKPLVSTAHNSCSSSSGVPCDFTFSVAMTTGAGASTQSVPATSVCTVTPTVTTKVSSSNIITYWVTLSSTTLTIHAGDLAGTATTTFTGNGTCL